MKTVVIAGAGVIGLATALELTRRGYQVTILERGRALREASWAAAGMLAAADPENPAQLFSFAQYSLSLYPDFLARLEQLSGIAVPLNTTATLQLAGHLHENRHAKVLSSFEATRRIPGLRIGPDQTALWLEEQSIDPRVLGQALATAVRAAGIDLREETPVLSTSVANRQVAIETANETFTADALVVTAGAWSAPSASEPSLHLLPPGSVRPSKGQMLRVRPPTGTRLTAVIRSPRVYIVPRANGSLVIGATVEDAGYDRTIRDEATGWLLKEAEQLWSPLAKLPPAAIEEVWTGTRPGTADALPVVGSMSGSMSELAYGSAYGQMDRPARVIFATGHFRNGILLTPGTARVVAQLLDDEKVDVDITAFRPQRLLSPSELDASYGCTHDKETSATL